MNPYRINPSYAGIEARGAMFLTYRKQWVNIEGAPTIMNFSFHNASKANANFGINVNNDAIGIVNSTSFSFTLGYTLPVSKDQYVRFGISAGAAMNTFDIDKLGDAYFSDPDLERLLTNNFNMIGDVGLSYHNKFFSVGVAAPNVFSSSYDSLSSFAVGNFSAADKLIFHSNYRYYFGFEDKFAIEPHVIYRLRNKWPSQYEAALIFHMNHAFWIGGSYKQNFGISGVGGIKINALFALGYSYSIASAGLGELNSPSHEVQINMLFGKKKRLKQVYSFTDSKKPIIRKTRRQLLAEQHKAERERIEADKVAAAKAAIAQAEQEKQKRLAEEQAEVAQVAQQQKDTEVRQQQANAQRQQQEEVARIAQQQKDTEVRQQQADTQKQQQAEVAQVAQQQKDTEVRQQQAEAQRQQQAEVAQVAQQQKDTEIRQQQAEAQRQQQAEVARIAQQQKDIEVRQQQVEAQRQQQEEVALIAQEQKKQAEQEQLIQERQTEKEDAKIAQQQQQQETELASQKHETKIDDKGNVESTFTTNEKIAVKQGGHFLELQSGEYVVVGAFVEFEHAELYSDRLFEKGYKTRFGYITQTKLWYVYISELQDIEVARKERDKYRKLNLFKNVWVLTVEQ